QYHDSQPLVRDHLNLRDESSKPAGMADQFVTTIVSQGPPQTIVGKVGFESGERRRGIFDRQYGLRRPHFSGLLFAVQVRIGVRKLTMIQLQKNPSGHFRSTGIYRACWGCIVERNKIDGLHLAWQPGMRPSVVVP